MSSTRTADDDEPGGRYAFERNSARILAGETFRAGKPSTWRLKLRRRP